MLNILIVDDERIIREGVRRIIETECRFPVCVRTAPSGGEGLELARRLLPDVMLVDINMPEMDGFALIDAMHDAGLSCELIVLTGYDEYDYAVKAIRRQVLDYLLKPVDQALLLELLYRVYNKKQIRLTSEKRKVLRDVKANMLYQEPFEALETDFSELTAHFPMPYLAAALIAEPENETNEEIRFLRALAEHTGLAPGAMSVTTLAAPQVSVRLILSAEPIGHRALYTAARAAYRNHGRASLTSVRASAPTEEQLSRLPSVYMDAWKNLICERICAEGLYERWVEQGADVDLLNYDGCKQLTRLGAEAVVMLREMAETLSSRGEWAYLIAYANLCASLWLRARRWMPDPASTLIRLPEDCRAQREPISRERFIYLAERALRESAVRMRAPDNRYTPNVRKAIEYIDRNYARLQSIDQVAANIHLHPNYLSSLLKKELGMTFVRYVNELRIEQAKRLLREDADATVEWVAEVTGFSTERHFYKVFKELTGLSPGGYRATDQQEF